MAHEAIQTILPGMITDGNFSTKQFYFAKISTAADFTASVCTTDGEPAIGVIQGNPTNTGEAVSICVSGVTKVIAGETITAGQHVKTASDGRCNVCDITTTGADTGDHVVGVCLEGGAVNEKITIFFGTPYFKVAV